MKFDAEHRKKLSISAKKRKIQSCGFKGKSHSSTTKEKISINRKGKSINEERHNWKGDDVSYRNLHRWVERRLGKPNFCQNCGDTTLNHRQYHWANKSRTYLRELSDWVRLCAKCHKRFDKIKTS